MAAVLTSKMAEGNKKERKTAEQTTNRVATAGSAVEVEEGAGELAAGVQGRVPVGAVRALARSRCGLKLS